jgi:hypothetical protein
MDTCTFLTIKEQCWPAGNPETGYANTNSSLTKTEILNLNRSGENKIFWEMNFGKHPREELFKIDEDEHCLNNLADIEGYKTLKAELSTIITTELKVQKDPRMFGNGDVFDSYIPDRNTRFYERDMNDEKVNSGWINQSDFEEDFPFG